MTVTALWPSTGLLPSCRLAAGEGCRWVRPWEWARAGGGCVGVCRLGAGRRSAVGRLLAVWAAR